MKHYRIDGLNEWFLVGNWRENSCYVLLIYRLNFISDSNWKLIVIIVIQMVIKELVVTFMS